MILSLNLAIDIIKHYILPYFDFDYFYSTQCIYCCGSGKKYYYSCSSCGGRGYHHAGYILNDEDSEFETLAGTEPGNYNYLQN